MPHKDPEKRKEYCKRYYKDHKDERKEYHKQWYQDHKEEKKAYVKEHPRQQKYNPSWHLKNRYGITLEEYDIIFDEQNGVCKICGQPEINKRLSVDHDHQTNKIRGLLCDRCNKSIGAFEDDITLLAKAIEYLNGSK